MWKRTELTDTAGGTIGFFCQAHAPAVILQQMAKTHPLLLGDDFHQIGFDLVRVDVFRKSEPLRETRDVSIHTDGLSAVSVA